MSITRIGIVGAGNMGRAHATAYRQNRGRCEVVAVTDINRDSAEAFARDFGVDAEKDAASLVAREDVQAVSVCTVEGTHRPIVEAAAVAGKHVLVEKPLAIRLEDADAMIDAAHRARVKLMVCHTRRFDARCVGAQRAIQEGRIGKVVSLSCSMQGIPAQQDRIKDKDLSVMVFRGVHAFDLMRWLAASEVVRVYAEAARGALSRQGYGSEDTTFTLLRFASGAIGCVEVGSMCPPNHPSKGESALGVFGTEGMLRVHLSSAFHTIVNAGGLSSVGPGRLWFRDEIAAFLDCIENNLPPAVTGEDGRAALAIALAAVASAQSGKTVAPS